MTAKGPEVPAEYRNAAGSDGPVITVKSIHSIPCILIPPREEQRHKEMEAKTLRQGCQTHFHWGPHQPRNCLQRAEIILELYKCNYSLTIKELKLHSAL